MPPRPPSRFAALAATVLILAGPPAEPGTAAGRIPERPMQEGAIYRCPGEAGIPRFSQFPCRGSGPDRERIDLTPLQLLRVAPLDASERRRLEQLERQRELRDRNRARAAHEARRASRRHREARLERCRAARAGLQGLRDERRQGYPLRRAPALERREAELDARIAANC